MTTVDHATFEFREAPAGRVLQSTALAFVPHLFTTRDIGERGDRSAADLQRLSASLEIDPDDLVLVKQVHGRTVLIVRGGEALAEPPSADAIVSTDPERAICVRVADCVPILLADRGGRAVAAVHAGWRGTCAGVAVTAVQ